MNNKPVAWRKVVGNVTKHYQYNEIGEGTPLYTQPAEHDLGIAEAIGFDKGYKAGKPADLTDEEIWKLHNEHIDEVTCGHHMKTVGFIEFARAILRKVNEK